MGAARLCALLSTVSLLGASYYLYLPLPDSVAEPHKLMVLDAVFRTAQHVGTLTERLGLCDQVTFLQTIISCVARVPAHSDAAVFVRDAELGGVRVRAFTSTRRGGGPKRAVVYLHGGGWALSGAQERGYDSQCREMASSLDAVVISVDYRLVPQHRFPVPLEDCLRATRHFLRHDTLAAFSVDPARVAISGDSAGGNLAVAVALQLAREPEEGSASLKLQALIYPVLQALDFQTPSYRESAYVPILYGRTMVRFWLQYLGGDVALTDALLDNAHSRHVLLDPSGPGAFVDWRSLLPPPPLQPGPAPGPPVGPARPDILAQIPALLDPRASPLLADDDWLRTLPLTYVLTCEHDVLRDDGAMLVARLGALGVPVHRAHLDDAFHGVMQFMQQPLAFAVGRRALDGYLAWLDANL
ncbi:neutral cholesterol ester hydrolase 1 [Lethenteron reissneri]|uniref:neutral cholesterol ester hydrolase 1 n=1 Tax=Lethenteron reissneri TaxID=7753 RepID=UPI002AB5EF18|nr:neutral cholesterol ester hydrolase 1 [Lethenteron reissneri]XP_061431577.1 neutral cholesterol ester hydrolase 1 [Lethenteron reissneri]XP_061431578.1 neutral cholesterol ester hydrolase 1 [Lethenteron reissneri]XP_061431579.1 neutral cholesterol ester hydrolase 1 [Lethenteron reissneri]XP_061431580.1 neutral cholesterol ester hydrolase 1 [Lethenteron reissneri]XP_061431581.1 neutral cholesterol ester hydrolase 1 [Lethenteron reissneri]